MSAMKNSKNPSYATGNSKSRTMKNCNGKLLGRDAMENTKNKVFWRC